MPATKTRKSPKPRPAVANDAYLTLVERFPLRPIRTETQHATAMKVFAKLRTRQDADARDYRTVLASLIEDHECSTIQSMTTSDTTPADIIRHLAAEHSLSINQLAKATSLPQSSLSEMLSGTRQFSKAAITALSNHFAISPAIFFR